MQDLQDREDNEGHPEDYVIAAAYTGSVEDAQAWLEEIRAAYPGREIVMNPLSLSVACHIGPGAVAVTVSKSLACLRREYSDN